MTGWERNADWNRDVLERIVALLFALAGLADRAACLPFLRRREVLGILVRGETVALAFVIGLAARPPMRDDVPEPTWTDEAEPSGDATRLGASFRALALMLCAMLTLTRRFALPSASGPRTARCKAGGPAASLRLMALPAPDTS